MASIACRTTRAPFAQVANVVKENRLAAGAELQGVQVTRGNARLTTTAGLVLQKGDRIETDHTTEAVILFGDVYEVILGPDTTITISPDFFVDIGKAVVRKLKEIRKKFQAETKYVNAGVEHTQFAISVDPGDVVSVVVLEGSVTLESTQKKWPPQTIRAREKAVVRAEEPPSRRERVPQSELDRTFGWARRVEVIALPEVPNLDGLLLNDARQRLIEAGLQLGSVEKVAAAGKPLNTVVGQGTPPGQPVPRGSRVNLRVTGESVVPDVRGMSSLEASLALSLAGLQAGETTEEEGTGGKPGKVARQSPAPGTRVPPGKAVSLVMAARTEGRGEEGERGETTRRNEGRVNPCTVPDVLSAGQANARRVVEAAGLTLNVQQRIEGPPTQSPKPGTQVPCGSAVDVAW